MEELDIDSYFMKLAYEASRESNCGSRQVGAVIVKDGVVYSRGHNASPNGVIPCIEKGGCMRKRDNIPSGTRQEHCMAVHAEQSAIINAARYGKAIEGATLYVTTFPCGICARMIINCGFEKIIYDGEYQDKLGYELFKEAGINIYQIGSLNKQKVKIKKR